jgi:phospholipase/lecithinase/hemolysin
MKTLFRTAFAAVLLGLAAFPAKATFTSMYVFGDALSTTTNNTVGSSSYPKQYYGKRYSNGRVWVEVLAQRQGIPIANNWSYFDDNSSNLVTNVKNFNNQIPPTALVVVWCNDSDLYDQAIDGSTSAWATNAISQGTNNEFVAIGNLCNKGARTLVMPSPVDLSEVPGFDLTYNTSYLNSLHQLSTAYNIAFSNMLNQARAANPSVTIIEPDFFDLLNNVLTNASAYSLTNALSGGNNIDARENLGNAANTNGLGANYIYWDYLDPSARFHEVIADNVQQILAPVAINSLSVIGNPNYTTLNVLSVSNMPVGLNGFVDGLTSTNGGGSTPWAPVIGFNSTSSIQSVSFNAPPLAMTILPSGNGSLAPGSEGSSGTGAGNTQTNFVPTGAMESYQLRFPYNWTWP